MYRRRDPSENHYQAQAPPTPPSYPRPAPTSHYHYQTPPPLHLQPATIITNNNSLVTTNDDMHVDEESDFESSQQAFRRCRKKLARVEQLVRINQDWSAVRSLATQTNLDLEDLVLRFGSSLLQSKQYRVCRFKAKKYEVLSKTEEYYHNRQMNSLRARDEIHSDFKSLINMATELTTQQIIPVLHLPETFLTAIIFLWRSELITPQVLTSRMNTLKRSMTKLQQHGMQQGQQNKFVRLCNKVVAFQQEVQTRCNLY